MAGENAKEDVQMSVGTRMSDGTVYAGISPDTHKPMYATPSDAQGTYTFNQAAKYAQNLDAHGHHDFRVPTIQELKVLFQNHAAIGGFDTSGSDPTGYYWSSLQDDDLPDGAWLRNFDDGFPGVFKKNLVSSLRCVR
jgi:hypothetical protein